MNAAPVEPLAYTYAAAAAAVGVHVDTIRGAVRSRDLPVRYIGAKPVIERDELLAWLRSRPSTAPHARATRS